VAAAVRAQRCPITKTASAVDEAVIRRAQGDELVEAFRVRQSVFCEEQGLFEHTDEDDWDLGAVHLVALEGDRVVGTVRLYESEPGVWIGGRLAVLPGHRRGIGAGLVRCAVEEARRVGALVFRAQVQERNEAFFRRLGWRTTGRASYFCSVRHVEMEAQLDPSSGFDQGGPTKGLM
jgi:putative N-acetyltransferase (TIGR04045 family)